MSHLVKALREHSEQSFKLSSPMTADLSAKAADEIERLQLRRAEALYLLRRMEYLRYGATVPGLNFVCPVCGWPQEGHDGPGRYKGNEENTHEEGCSLYAVLHGQPASRIADRIYVEAIT
jgi:hypothetical protein